MPILISNVIYSKTAEYSYYTGEHNNYRIAQPQHILWFSGAYYINYGNSRITKEIVMVMVKLSSICRSGSSGEIANLKYINRHGTMQDEIGQKISIEDALKKYNFDRRTTSYRVIVSLPKIETQKALDLVEAIMAGRYSSFVSAVHLKNDKDIKQPHIHFSVQAKGYDAFCSMQEIFSLQREIDEAFKTNNLKFSPTQKLAPAVREQSELHMLNGDKDVWKENIRDAIKTIIKDPQVNSFHDFEVQLNKQGITIARKTENSLTLENAEGRKVRISRLFTRVRTQKDLETLISKHKLKPTQNNLKIRSKASPTGKPKSLSRRALKKTTGSPGCGKSRKKIERWLPHWEIDEILNKQNVKKVVQQPAEQNITFGPEPGR